MTTRRLCSPLARRHLTTYGSTEGCPSPPGDRLSAVRRALLLAILTCASAGATPLVESHPGGVRLRRPDGARRAAIFWNPAATGLVHGWHVSSSRRRRSMRRQSIARRSTRRPARPTRRAIAVRVLSSARAMPGGMVGLTKDLTRDLTIGVASGTPYTQRFPTGDALRYHAQGGYFFVDESSALARLQHREPRALRRLALNLDVPFFQFAFSRDTNLDGCKAPPCDIEDPAAAEQISLTSQREPSAVSLYRRARLAGRHLAPRHIVSQLALLERLLRTSTRTRRRRGDAARPGDAHRLGAHRLPPPVDGERRARRTRSAAATISSSGSAGSTSRRRRHDCGSTARRSRPRRSRVARALPGYAGRLVDRGRRRARADGAAPLRRAASPRVERGRDRRARPEQIDAPKLNLAVGAALRDQRALLQSASGTRSRCSSPRPSRRACSRPGPAPTRLRRVRLRSRHLPARRQSASASRRRRAVRPDRARIHRRPQLRRLVTHMFLTASRCTACRTASRSCSRQSVGARHQLPHLVPRRLAPRDRGKDGNRAPLRAPHVQPDGAPRGRRVQSPRSRPPAARPTPRPGSTGPTTATTCRRTSSRPRDPARRPIRMQHLTLTEQQLESEREVVINERRFRVDDDVEGLLGEELFRRAFGLSTRYSTPTIGWMRDIEAAVDETIASRSTGRTTRRTTRRWSSPAISIRRARWRTSRRLRRDPVVAVIAEPVIEREPAAQSGERRATFAKPVSAGAGDLRVARAAAGARRLLALSAVNELLLGGASARLHRELVDAPRGREPGAGRARRRSATRASTRSSSA